MPDDIYAADRQRAQRRPAQQGGGRRADPYANDRSAARPRNPWERLRGGYAALTQGIDDAVSQAGIDSLTGVASIAGANRLPPVRNALIALQTAQDNRPRYEPRGQAENFLYNTGRFSTNALAPGGAAVRVASVAGPVLGGEIGEAMGGERGRAAGEIAGAVASQGRVRITRGGPARRSPEATTARSLRRAGPGAVDAAAMRQRQADFEAAGVQNPTVADLTNTAGRRQLRANAMQGDQAQETARNFNAARREDMQSRISQQSRRTMSNDPRTPDQIREELVIHRRQQADRDYGAVHNEPMTMEPETVAVLRTDAGRAAIREAASLERDPVTRAALNRLADDALDNPNTPVTVGMMDSISRALRGRAGEAGRAGNNNRADLLGGFSDDVRNPTRAAFPGYGRAVDNFAADSRLMEAATLGEEFMSRNTDEFVASASRLSDDERLLAQAAARRAVERQSGEGLGGAMGVADRLAHSREQGLRTRALFDPEQADAIRASMAAEARIRQNAIDIDPRSGSQTQPNQMAQTVANGIGAAFDVGQALGGSLPAMVRIATWFARRGFSEQEAAQIVDAATDPRQTEAVLRAIEARGGPGAAQEFLRITQSPVLALTASTAIGGLGSQQ